MHNRSISCRHAILALAFLILQSAPVARAQCTNVSTRFVGVPATNCVLAPLSQQATNPICEVVNDGFPLAYWLVTISNAPAGYSLTNGTYRGWCADYDVIIESGIVYEPIAYLSTMPLPAHLADPNWSRVNYILNHKRGNAFDVQSAIWRFIGGPVSPFDPVFGTLTADGAAMVADANAFGGSFVPSAGEVTAVILDVGPTNQLHFVEVACPAILDVCHGANLTLCTTNTGSGPLTFMWFKDGVMIQGATDDCLALSGLAPTDSGTYSVKVSNPCSSATNMVSLVISNTADTIPPVIGCASNRTFQCLAQVPPLPDLGVVTNATDNSGQVTVTFASETITTNGCELRIVRRYRAADPCGNAATCDHTIIVRDTIAPTWSGVPADASYQCLADVPAPPAANATDNCDTNLLVIRLSSTNGICPMIIQHRWTATDHCGNSVTNSQMITVLDTVRPTITCPANLLVPNVASIPPRPTTLAQFMSLGGLAGDNCDPNLSYVCTDGPLSGGDCGGQLLRTHTVMDDCTNLMSCVQAINILTSAPPTIVCPPAITVQCPADVPPCPDSLQGFLGAGGSAAGNIVSYACSDTLLVGGACGGTITRTHRVVDTCSNAVSCTQTITVHDTTPPIITCATNFTVECGAAWAFTPPVASDLCSGTNVIISILGTVTNVGSCPRNFSVTRTWQTADACTNIAVCSQTVTITDTTPPLITCAGNATVECGSAWSFAPPTASDLCGGTDVTIQIVNTITNSAGFCGRTFSATRTWRALDSCSNAATCSQTITIIDTTPPALTCAPDQIVECGTAWNFTPPVAAGLLAQKSKSRAALAGFTASTADDLCDGTNVTIRIVETVTNAVGFCSPTFTAVRTWEAIDQCGNRSTCSQRVIVLDTTPPTITCAADRTVECTATWAFNPPTASDLCAGTNVSINIVSTETNVPNPLCPRLISVTRTWRAADPCNNAATCSQTITTVDTTPPSLTCATNAIIECGSSWSFPRPSAADACDGTNVTIEIVSTITNAGPCGRALTATRTWRAYDSCTNIATCSQSVTVVDSQPPVLSCAADEIIECGSPWAFTPPFADDLCDGTNVTVAIVGTVTNSFCGRSFSVTRTWRATDVCGNIAACNQTITIADTRPPVLTCAANQIIECGSPWAFTAPSATDLCDGTNVVVSIVSTVTNTAAFCGNTFSVTRTWRATDSCTNAATCQQTITIIDTRPPQLTCAPDDIVECSQPWTFTEALAIDLCDGIMPVTIVSTITNAGSCPGNFNVTRTWRAVDSCSNAATCSQTITVTDTRPPTITCAPNEVVECHQPWAFAPPTASDLCDGTNVTISIVSTVTNAANPRCPNLMSIVRTWRAADRCGNTAQCSQTITLVDTQPPTITCAGNQVIECSSQWAFTPPSAADLCDGTNVAISVVGTVTNAANPRCPNLMSIVRTWRAADTCGNAAQCSQTITLVDTQPPTITCAPDETIECGNAWAFTAPTATDLCDGTNVTIALVGTVTNIANPRCPGLFSVVRTWRATDSCNNASTCSQTINLVDTRPPSITCATDRVVDCNVPWAFTPPTAADLCDGNVPVQITSTITNAGACRGNFSVTRTWRALDSCSNAATCTQTITVVDTTPPVLNCGPDRVVECATAWSFTAPTAEDLCDLGTMTIQVVNTVTNAGSCPRSFSVIRTWRALDACSNAATCSQTITVRDTVPPSLTCAPDQIVECGDNWMFTLPSVVDACDGTNVTVIILNTETNAASPRCPGLYSVKRMWRATDSCGNAATCSQTINVFDTRPPTLTCGPDRVVECGDMGMFDAPAAVDICDGTNVTIAIVSTMTNAANTPCPALYSIKRTWRATDACGNESTCSQTLNVVDTTAPTLVCAADRVIECGSMVMFHEPGATDACDGTNVTVSIVSTVTNAASPRCPGLYSVKRTWRATDTCGNEATCSQNISVVDTTPPTLTCAADRIIECGDMVMFNTPTAVDACDSTNIAISIVSTVTNVASPRCPGLYSVKRTWRATDTCGNESTCNQTISVVDTRPPELVCARNEVVECGQPWSFTAPTATDICDGTITPTLVSTTTNAACGRTLTATRTWRAADSCGNAVTCSQTIRVVDTTPPALSCALDRVIECGDMVMFNAPSAVDICDGTNVTITIVSTMTNAASPRCPGLYSVKRTWRATDTCGNESTCHQTISVVDTRPPELTCARNEVIECGQPWNFTAPTATDICDGTITPIIVSTTTNATCGRTLIATRTWRATDSCSNASTCNQVITVVDTTPPALTCAEDRSVECAFPWTFTAPTVRDLCDGTNVTLAVVGTVTNAGACPNNYTAIRTWRATDTCGNAATCSQTIVVADTRPPTLICAADRVVECGLPWAFTGPSVDDLCDGTNVALAIVSTVTNAPSPECPNMFTIVRTWRATDRCGNSSQCSQTILEMDSTPPALSCPSDRIVECGQPWAFGLPFADDLCDGTNLTIRIVSTTTNAHPSCPKAFTALRMWSATDRCGNISRCGQAITLVDTTPPNLTCAGSFIIECGQPWEFTRPFADDVCDGTNVTIQVVGTVTNNVSPCGRTFSVTRTWRALDSCTNITLCSQTITVVDTLPPTLVCPQDRIVECGGSWAFSPPSATDICAGTNITVRILSTVTNTAGFCGRAFSATRTWEAFDTCSISTTGGAVVLDSNFDSMPAPASVITVGGVFEGWRVLTGDIDIVSSVTPVGPIGLCGPSHSGLNAVDIDGNNPGSISTNITTIPGRTYVLSFAFTRNGVIIQGATNLPRSAEVALLGVVTNIVSADPPSTCVDLFWRTTNFTFVANSTTTTLRLRSLSAAGSGGIFFDSFQMLELGAPPVVGNRSTCSQTITVVDTQPPVLVCAPDRVVECGSSWNFNPPNATDLCDTNVMVRIVNTTTNLLCGRTLTATRTWEAVDACGNRSTCAQTITVADTQPPVIICAPDFTVECGQPWNFAPPTATDICSTNVNIQIVNTVTNTTGLRCPQILSVRRTWRATDACGNSALCSQTVLILDTTAPVLLNVPANASFKCLPAVPPPVLVGATDACDRNPTIHLTIMTNGACPTVITRIWEAHDACSNVVSATQTITVIEDAPVITAAPVNATVCPGSNATFCVTATADCGLGYQWSRNGVLIPGATDRCYTVTNAQPADAGRYCVVVSSPCHSRTNCANLSFVPPVEVGLLPTPPCVVIGTELVFCPQITGPAALPCAWYHNGAKISFPPGSSNCCLIIPAFSPGMEGRYTFYYTGNCNVASSELTLPPPMIHCGPDNCDDQAVCEGAAFTICETIIVPMPGVNYAYQWFRGDNSVTNMLAGETNSCITRSNVTPADAGFYGLRVIATLNSGSVTQIFCGGTITVLRRTVADGPRDLEICSGSNATFSVTASGAGPFTYMWFKDGMLIPGQTNNSILILNAAPADMGLYCVKVTGACGSVTNCARLSLRSSVGDFVWEDLNFNGCQDANEPGISNVVVQLLDCTGANILRHTLTDGGGHYLFECVEPGDYRVRFVTPSAAWMFTLQTNAVCTTAGDSNAEMATGVTRCFTLPPGTSNLAFDAGMIRKACLGDLVWEDLNHNGRQDAGEPGIPDVPLVLIECATTNIVAATTTGPNGEYQFCGLIPGSYRIEILVPGGYFITVPNSGISDCDDSDAHPGTRLTGCIVLPPGANDICVDIGLKRFSALGDFVWHDLNRDGRQDAGEPGISNVTVRLHDCATLNIIATQTTDGDGRYFFGGLTGGTYKVTFVAPPGLLFTTRDAIGVADHLDSDADPISGMSGCYPLPPGTTNLTVDAGLFPPLPPCLEVTKTIACLLPADQCGPFDKSATGYRSATQNPAFCYSITISNCGGHTLTNLSVLDDKMGDLTTNFFASKLTQFAPGATLTRFYKIAWDVDTTNTVNASGRAVADGAQQVSDNDLAIAFVENASVTCQTTVFSPDDQDTSFTDGHVTLVDDGTAHEVTFMIVTCNNGDVDLANVTIRTPGLAVPGCADPAPFALPRGACRTNILCVKQLTCDTLPLSLTNHVTASVDTRNNHCGYDLPGSNITTRSECHMEVQCGMPGSCRVTGGGRQEDSFPPVRYVTHGGQVGAPVGNAGFDPGTFEREGSECIHGNWQHVRHEKGGNRGNFHAKIYDSLMCACLGCPEDPLAGVVVGGLCNPDNRICGPEPRRAPANKICFSGIGDYTMTSGNRESRAVLFRVDIEDRSEPGNSHAGGSQVPHDRHRIRMWILTDAEKARLNDRNDRLLDMRRAISCSPGSTALQDGAVGANGLAVPLGTAVFGLRAPDVDDGGEMDHGNHQIHPMIKDCPK